LTCTKNSDCCSGFCGIDQLCHATACLSVGTACTTNTACCTGNCAGGVCATTNGGMCLPSGNACTIGSQCCSQLCANGTCDGGSSFCRQNNDTCTSSTQCCSGDCEIPNGASAGTCQDIKIGSIGSCLVAGTLTACTGLNAQGYACNQACCSRSCGTSGASNGATICEPPSGCAPLGELCQTNSDCCGNTKPGGLQCDKASPTAQFGRCGSENAWSKAGEICKLATISLACSVANNCCEPSGLASGTCNSSPELCCGQDELGIPRCLLNATCSNPGGTCSTS